MFRFARRGGEKVIWIGDTLRCLNCGKPFVFDEYLRGKEREFVRCPFCQVAIELQIYHMKGRVVKRGKNSVEKIDGIEQIKIPKFFEAVNWYYKIEDSQLYAVDKHGHEFPKEYFVKNGIWVIWRGQIIREFEQ